MPTTVTDTDRNSSVGCSPCYYGSFCHFTTSHHSISLETLVDESFPSQEVVGCIIVVFLFGIACNMLSVATFYRASHGRGNRIYRLWISVVGQLGTIAFGLRLLLLFTRRTSGNFECFVLDYLMTALPELYYSLTACVFIEQVVVAYRHLHFDKENSRHTATLIIPLLTAYHLLINLYKPFHRQLLADPYVPSRSWCAFRFPTGAPNDFERITNVLNLAIPFTLNFLSPIVMLIVLTRDKTMSRENTRIWSNLKEVVCLYKRNVAVPYILVILTMPYLIVTFGLSCVTQSWQNSVYLMAYFVYLSALLISFFIFVLPSPTFRDELHKMWQCSIIYVRLRQS